MSLLHAIACGKSIALVMRSDISLPVRCVVPPEMRAGGTTIVRAVLFPRRTGNWPNRADRAPVVGTEPRLASRCREIEAGVGGADMRFGEAQFAAHDVGAFDQRDAFVIRDPS